MKSCSINEQQCFIGLKSLTKGGGGDFRPEFIKRIKDISRKACLSGVDNNDTLVNVRN